jgi:serine/threonine protein kinase
MSLDPGSILIGKYRIERVLGKGGMGVVVLATHVDLEDKVAIKVLTGELDGDAQQRFLREARAAAQIKSDHIARVFDVGTLPTGVPYMVMEFLEGSDLAAVLEERGALPVPEAIGLVLEACFGLTEAHAKAFVHRDIKPANLYVATYSDGRRVLKLLDFGISKATQDVALTSTRAVLGTPAYMAPEPVAQREGRGRAE